MIKDLRKLLLYLCALFVAVGLLFYAWDLVKNFLTKN
jgi:hypothetical protein